MKIQRYLTLALALIPGSLFARTAIPGTLNYVEGQVSVDGRTVTTQQDGTAALKANQTLTTGAGKAEILLSPGSFVRVGSNSAIRMVAPNLADPRLEITRGEAMVEVDYKPKSARMNVIEHGADAAILKEGLYRFNADAELVAVLDGKVSVDENGRTKEFGKGKEVQLNTENLKPQKFDRKAQDELYQWSSVRASYLAQANEASARTVYLDGGWGADWGMGWGPGWFWNPYYSTYSWMPGDGFFWSPFGYPFYSPGYVIYAPTVGGVSRVPGGRRPTVAAGRGSLPLSVEPAMNPRVGAFAARGAGIGSPRPAVSAPMAAPRMSTGGAVRGFGGRR